MTVESGLSAYFLVGAVVATIITVGAIAMDRKRGLPIGIASFLVWFVIAFTWPVFVLVIFFDDKVGLR